MDLKSLQIAMNGCDQVYHTAAFTKVWCKDVSLIYRSNIEGTLNVIRAGIKEGIKRFVFTSTAGVLGSSILNGCIDENSPSPDNDCYSTTIMASFSQKCCLKSSYSCHLLIT